MICGLNIEKTKPSTVIPWEKISRKMLFGSTSPWSTLISSEHVFFPKCSKKILESSRSRKHLLESIRDSTRLEEGSKFASL